MLNISLASLARTEGTAARLRGILGVRHTLRSPESANADDQDGSAIRTLLEPYTATGLGARRTLGRESSPDCSGLHGACFLAVLEEPNAAGLTDHRADPAAVNSGNGSAQKNSGLRHGLQGFDRRFCPAVSPHFRPRWPLRTESRVKG